MHVAGRIVDGKQHCSRCNAIVKEGEPFIKYMQMVPMGGQHGFFPPCEAPPVEKQPEPQPEPKPERVPLWKGVIP